MTDIPAITFTPTMYSAERNAALQAAGEQVARHAIAKGGMTDDEQWEYVTEHWWTLSTMGVEKVLHHAAVVVRRHCEAAIQTLGRDFA